jgi:hypothetical protein
MAKKTTTTFTFSVTFKAPQGMNIPTARMHIKDALMSVHELELAHPQDVKVHLTNKEVKYG